MEEGLAILLGILAIAGIFVLPVITICIINGLRGKVDDLSAEVGGLRRLLNADKKTEAPASTPRKAPAPVPIVEAVESSRMQSSAVEKEPPPTHAWSPMAGVVPLDVKPESPPFKWTDATAREDARPPQRPEDARPPQCPLEGERPREPSAAQAAVLGALSRAWNWIVVGEEFRRPGVAAEFAIATAWLVRVGVLVIVLAGGFLLQLSIA
ncbi:MAG: hypothetical protein FWH21_09020, partial [Kiritimatiellaeota bacterium]|nr:hypothetical protein [Kiritimatiellota bacterium]